MSTAQSNLFSEIEKIISQLNTESISDDRKSVLQSLIVFIQSKVSNGLAIRMNFICTHNSRRSHLSQIWAQTLAHYFNIKNVYCYSGGTEATALYPMVVDTLKHSGFKIEKHSEGTNPVYSIKFAENEHPVIGFSKQLDDDFNPKSEFAAIMTCNSANEACPLVRGAEQRIPITYEDPKVFDNTPLQAEKYNERRLQIAPELCYVLSNIKS